MSLVDAPRAALAVLVAAACLTAAAPAQAGCGGTQHRKALTGEEGADADAVRAAGRAHPDRIVVLDWARHTRGRDAWLQPDGIHLTDRGAAALARFLAAATPYAGGPVRTEDGARQEGAIAVGLP
jgi:hypothetical protein